MEIRWLQPKHQENDYYEHNFRLNRGDTAYVGRTTGSGAVTVGGVAYADDRVTADISLATFTKKFDTNTCCSGNVVVDDGAISLGLSAAIALGAAALAF